MLKMYKINKYIQIDTLINLFTNMCIKQLYFPDLILKLQ